jgi:hypothetical protein
MLPPMSSIQLTLLRQASWRASVGRTDSSTTTRSQRQTWWSLRGGRCSSILPPARKRFARRHCAVSPHPSALVSTTRIHFLHIDPFRAFQRPLDPYQWRGCIQHTVAVLVAGRFAGPKARAVRRLDQASMLGERCRPRLRASPAQ